MAFATWDDENISGGNVVTDLAYAVERAAPFDDDQLGEVMIMFGVITVVVHGDNGNGTVDIQVFQLRDGCDHDHIVLVSD